MSVYVRPSFSNPNLRLPCAESMASAIFDQIGVRIQWRRGRPKPDMEKLAVQIAVSSNTPRDFHTGALAYALAFEGEHIQIFWDRLKDIAHDQLVTKVLAHVMVHEITHILEGTDHHSPEGIMKARWTGKDLAQLTYKPLTFDREDVKLIYDGLALRRSRIESAARTENVSLTGSQPRGTGLSDTSPAMPSPLWAPSVEFGAVEKLQ